MTRAGVLDGKNLTLVDKKKNAYGQAVVPPTIDGALDKLASDYGVVVAVAELLRTNLYERVAPNLQTGQYLGKDTIAVYECDHLGFTTADKDVEVWLQTGASPLLRKISMSYKNVPSRPRYTMLITGFDPTPVPDQLLKAQIPEGAAKIDLVPLPTAGAATQPGGSK
jgi:hypothetical protein